VLTLEQQQVVRRIVATDPCDPAVVTSEFLDPVVQVLLDGVFSHG